MAAAVEPIMLVRADESKAKPAEDTNAIRSFGKLSNFMISEVKKSWIGRHVNWLKNSDSTPEKCGKRLLTGVEVTGLALSIVGIPLIVLGFSKASTLEKYKELAKVGHGVELVPPDLDSVPIRDVDTMTFNHTHEFVLKDGFIWVKPLKTDRTAWRLFYYDGYIKGKTPVGISADGANFVALDNENVVHYKKILEESRSKLFCWTGKYHSVDLTNKDNYEKDWFSLPIARLVYDLFHKNELKLRPNTTWSMSHRGKFVAQFEDADGFQHPEFSMTTTLHWGEIGSNVINYDDPFWPTSERLALLPANFKLIKLSSSAGIVYAYGTEEGIPVWYIQKSGDFDKDGRNPFLPGYWFRGLRADNTWVRHPNIPITGRGSHTAKITIYQTGVGDREYKMVVPGTDAEGVEGIWTKWIHEMDPKDWVFKAAKTSLSVQEMTVLKETQLLKEKHRANSSGIAI